MVTGYITLKAGERLQVSDQVFIADEQSWKTVDEHDAKYGMIVAPGSLCRRPVGIAADDAAGEWEEEEKEDRPTLEEEEKEDRPTLEEELTKTDEYLQRTLKENMELHNRLQTMKEHVDSLKKQLAALEEKLKAQENISAVVIEAAAQERAGLITERDNLRQEVHSLQHAIVVARTENEKLRSNPANSSLLQYEKKIAELQQKLQVSEERRLRLLHTDSVSAEQPETELEQKA